jgi:hypothetical protein
MSDQDTEEAGGVDAFDLLLAVPAMVLVAAGANVQASVDSSEGEASVVPNGPTTSAGEIDHVISPCGCKESNGKQQPFGQSGLISPGMSLHLQISCLTIRLEWLA